MNPQHTKIKPVEVQALNGRVLVSEGMAPSLDREGFMFHPHLTSVAPADFEDIETVLTQYFPEVEQIIRQHIPGVARVLIFDHALRSGGERLKTVEQVNPYASLVHCDTTVRSGHTRVKDQILGTNETVVKYGRLPDCWGDVQPSEEWQRKLFRAETKDHESPEGLGGEHMIVNVWRPIQEAAVAQWPLAVLDATSLPQGDEHPSILQTYDNTPGGKAGSAEKQQDDSELKVSDLSGQKLRYRIGEVLTPLPDATHRWVVFPHMTIQETLLLKIFDSREDGRARFGVHSAAFDPAGDPDAHRSSIEVRCLVILEPTAKRQSTSARL